MQIKLLDQSALWITSSEREAGGRSLNESKRVFGHENVQWSACPQYGIASGSFQCLLSRLHILTHLYTLTHLHTASEPITALHLKFYTFTILITRIKTLLTGSKALGLLLIWSAECHQVGYIGLFLFGKLSGNLVLTADGWRLMV